MGVSGGGERGGGFGGWTGTGWVGLREECDSMMTSYGEEVQNATNQ